MIIFLRPLCLDRFGSNSSLTGGFSQLRSSYLALFAIRVTTSDQNLPATIRGFFNQSRQVD
jgi:hypothetical protein